MGSDPRKLEAQERRDAGKCRNLPRTGPQTPSGLSHPREPGPATSAHPGRELPLEVPNTWSGPHLSGERGAGAEPTARRSLRYVSPPGGAARGGRGLGRGPGTRRRPHTLRAAAGHKAAAAAPQVLLQPVSPLAGAEHMTPRGGRSAALIGQCREAGSRGRETRIGEPAPRGVRQDGGRRAAAGLVRTRRPPLSPPLPAPSRPRVTSSGREAAPLLRAAPLGEERAAPSRSAPPRGGGPHAAAGRARPGLPRPPGSARGWGGGAPPFSVLPAVKRGGACAPSLRSSRCVWLRLVGDEERLMTPVRGEDLGSAVLLVSSSKSPTEEAFGSLSPES